MTAELFQQWLDKLNSKMKCEDRSILLLVDNYTAHPDAQFSNVKLVFLPREAALRAGTSATDKADKK